MNRVIYAVLYVVISAVCLYLSVLFISPLWLEDLGSLEWKENSTFIPIGFLMLITLGISFIVMIVRAIKQRNIR